MVEKLEKQLEMGFMEEVHKEEQKEIMKKELKKIAIGVPIYIGILYAIDCLGTKLYEVVNKLF